MTRLTIGIILLVIVGMALPFGAVQSAAPPRASGMDVVLVRCDQDSVILPGDIVINEIEQLGVKVVKVPRGQGESRARAYRGLRGVKSAEVDQPVFLAVEPNDPDLSQQWGLDKIDAQEAWDTSHGTGVTIAILDTGIDLDHEDLADKVVGSVSLVGGSADDIYGHGTYCAGVAAAVTHNSAGVAGVGWESNLLNVKVVRDDGTGSLATVADGIVWATDNGADVISMSLTVSYSFGWVLDAALDYAWDHGVVLVGAAGNRGDSGKQYPAAYDWCIAVAATNVDDELASFSTYGSWVEVAAPGVNVYTTAPDGGYGLASGTSVSAPCVAGVAALVKQVTTDENGNGQVNDEVKWLIENYCDPISEIDERSVEFGRVNAHRSVTGEITGPVPTPTPTPTPSGLPMWVESIGFRDKGPNLTIWAKVADANGPVRGASVSFHVERDGAFVAVKTEKTGKSGIAEVVLRKADAGLYKVHISRMSASGHWWDTSQGVGQAENLEYHTLN